MSLTKQEKIDEACCWLNRRSHCLGDGCKCTCHIGQVKTTVFFAKALDDVIFCDTVNGIHDKCVVTATLLSTSKNFELVNQSVKCGCECHEV